MKFIYLLVLAVVTPFLVIMQPWPRYHTTKVENQGVLNETIWYFPDGNVCGKAWKEPGEDSWYAFHEHGTEFGHVVANKQFAYNNVEWWCRP